MPAEFKPVEGGYIASESATKEQSEKAVQLTHDLIALAPEAEYAVLIVTRCPGCRKLSMACVWGEKGVVATPTQVEEAMADAFDNLCSAVAEHADPKESGGVH